MAKKEGETRGRPRKKIDIDALRELAKIQCTDAEICAVLDCSPKTLKRYFSHIIAAGREEGKKSLRRAQWTRAVSEKSDTMLKWLGANYLKQTDKRDINHEGLPKPTVILFEDGQKKVLGADEPDDQSE